ncbi:hypothetical protein ANO11243_084000 [Dothideomycetidae sp. 11243]|nr:hypothetical protein ANO11243_084000 [fungal sp. No.11243]
MPTRRGRESNWALIVNIVQSGNSSLPRVLGGRDYFTLPLSPIDLSQSLSHLPHPTWLTTKSRSLPDLANVPVASLSLTTVSIINVPALCTLWLSPPPPARDVANSQHFQLQQKSPPSWRGTWLASPFHNHVTPAFQTTNGEIDLRGDHIRSGRSRHRLATPGTFQKLLLTYPSLQVHDSLAASRFSRVKFVTRSFELLNIQGLSGSFPFFPHFSLVPTSDILTPESLDTGELHVTLAFALSLTIIP